jgi:hypothetical protein
MRTAFALILVAAAALPACGRLPEQTVQEVSQKDVEGTRWHLSPTPPATNCEITFNTNAAYYCVRFLPGSAVTNTGHWGLSGPVGARLNLFPDDLFSPTMDRATIHWWFTDVASNRVAIFGGDSTDTRQWAILSRIGAEPGVPSRPGPPVLSSPRRSLIPVAIIGAGLLVCATVVIWLRFRIRSN